MSVSRRSDGAQPMGKPWANWLAASLIVVLVLFFFAKMAFSNLILARGDTFLYFYPYWQTASDALRAGHVPFWNPNIFMGVPFIANSQAGFFYPLNWPLWLLLRTPYAVSASILIHLIIAGLGVYVMGRRLFSLSTVAAFLAAFLFALGGYLTAQVEHVNQVQGLAWLPWLFVVIQPVVKPATIPAKRATWPAACLLLAGLFALQLLAGHTQSAFISGVALSLWLLVHLVYGQDSRRYMVQVAGLLVVAAVVAGALAAVQLLPTLELTRYSSRQGGLSPAEVLSFSWHPLHITRSLLPSYGQSLFTEFVAFLPLTGLILAVVGGWRGRGRPEVAGLLVLVIAGLVLALGRFTPVYWPLANLPGFDLFRVPARWLVLYALGMALLAGMGWDALADTTSPVDREWVKRPLIAGLLLVLLLMVWGFAAGMLAGILPTGTEAPFERPNGLTVAGWILELGLLSALLVAVWRGQGRPSPLVMGGILALAGVVLWLSSRGLPYNNLTTPEAYFDVRPPAARLQALAECEVPLEPCRAPPDRFLSLSNIFFDPGDQAEIDSVYADQLDDQARYDYTIAVKQKEIIAPNLPMVYDLFSVDGFDGGVLPLAAYSELMQLILPEERSTVDGRLREYLTAVPQTRWLDLFNARYLITDKVGDEWRQGVFFDRQFPVTLAAGQETEVGFVPQFAADSLWMLASEPAPQVQIELSTGEQWRLAPELLEPPDLYQVRLPRTAEPATIILSCGSGQWCSVEALTMVDGAASAFQTVVPGPFRQIFSGDVKIYEYLAAMPRVWVVDNWQWQPDNAASVKSMQAPDFDPRLSAVLVGEGIDRTGDIGQASASEGRVEVVSESAEEIVMTVATALPGLVVMADANYPGWQATLDGVPTPIYQANGLFRGMFVEAGRHEIVFSYVSDPFRIGLLVTLAALAASVLGLLLVLRQVRRNR